MVFDYGSNPVRSPDYINAFIFIDGRHIACLGQTLLLCFLPSFVALAVRVSVAGSGHVKRGRSPQWGERGRRNGGSASGGPASAPHGHGRRFTTRSGHADKTGITRSQYKILVLNTFFIGSFQFSFCIHVYFVWVGYFFFYNLEFLCFRYSADFSLL